jgi:hypothetical protein
VPSFVPITKPYRVLPATRAAPNPMCWLRWVAFGSISSISKQVVDSSWGRHRRQTLYPTERRGTFLDSKGFFPSFDMISVACRRTFSNCR